MKNPTNTTVKLFGTAVLAAATLHQAPVSAAIINGDFSDATKFTNVAGATQALTSHVAADAGWAGVSDSPGRLWEQTGGVAAFSNNGQGGTGDRGGAAARRVRRGTSPVSRGRGPRGP